jgi:hypothetical protein
MTVRRCLTALVACLALALLAAPSSQADDTVTPMCNGQPCVAGWYTGPVFLSWLWSGGSATSGCANQYYAVDTVQAASCAVTFPDGSVTRQYVLNLEVSSPTAMANPARAPDFNGWYNHPVTIAFAGSSFSGIAWCTTTTYSGPYALNGVVNGTCTDRAGKTASASLSINYDATPPQLRVTAQTGDGFVDLSWQATATLASVTLSRSPGLRGAAPSILTRGLPRSFDDARVRNGRRYRYTITARDQAGNVTVRTVAITPGPHLLSPSAGARLARPPLLLWTPVRNASYYNLQLFSGGRKILSTWPGSARLRLTRAWSFGGQRFRLRPGRYVWYVWPGFGRRFAARYGRLVGAGSFRVVAAPRPG